MRLSFGHTLNLYSALFSGGGLAGWVIQWLLNPAILILVPLVILAITIGLVVRAFQFGDGNHGFRVLSAALLPFVAVVYLSLYQNSSFAALAKAGPIIGMLLAATIGFCIPFLKKFSNTDIASVIAVFCLSATFSVLVFSYVAVRGSSVFAYYYGFTFGALAHIVLVGLGGREPLADRAPESSDKELINPESPRRNPKRPGRSS